MIKKIIVLAACVAVMFNAVTVNAQTPFNFFEYVLKSAVNTIKDMYLEYESAQNEVSVPKTAEDIVTVCDVRRAVIGSDEVYLIDYFMNGAIQKEPLVAEEDCQVSGIKSDINSLACGDMIIIDTNFDDTVDFIRVVISLDNIESDKEFAEQISVPERAAWYLYGQENNAKNEVYFGYIMKTSVNDGKIRVTMTDRTGKLSNSEVFNVGEDTKVTVYDAYKKDEEARFAVCDIYDIEASIFPDVNGDMDFESEEFFKEDMRYAFIYVKRGEIKEIMLVNYSK